MKRFSIPAEAERRAKAPERTLRPGERENRWGIEQVICLDCRETFEIDDTCVSRDVGRQVGSGTRLLIVTLPECCPSCRNLRAAKAT